MTETTKKIAHLNDLLRDTFLTGRIVITDGINALPNDMREEIITRVREFKDFSPDNDPYGEHDFGSFELTGNKIFWKIDYYDRNYEFASENPADPKQTRRVLTIMLASEY